MRLAATEVGLELHHRIAATSGESSHCANQHSLQALGEISAPEELHRILVFVRSLAQMHLPEIGSEFGLLVTTARHILMRRHHFTPGLEVTRSSTLDGGTRGLALLSTRLLIEAHAQ